MTFCATISQRDNSNIHFKISNLKIMYFKPCQAKDRFFTKYVLEITKCEGPSWVGLRLPGAR